MDIELINTGTELLLGRVLNTNQQWLCRQLADMGCIVSRQIAVPDDGPAIKQAVREALARADLIITTGGLGPTSDDITRHLIAELLDKKLFEDADVLRQIADFFAARNRPMPASTRVQAMVPQDALVLANANGTAPGLAIDVTPNHFRPGGATSWLIMLPGPPRELRPMFSEVVAPLLRKVFPSRKTFVCRTLKTTGIGESIVEERIKEPLQELLRAGLELGYCARAGEVDVRLASSSPNAAAIVERAGGVIHALLGDNIYGRDDDVIEAVVIRLLEERQQTLCVAESCTGGFIAHRLTNIPGASAVFAGGFITYSDESKQQCLAVQSGTLERHGAVSEQTAREMAEGARSRIGADYAIAVTGIAGPAGGSDLKPVGTVFIALASSAETHVLHRVNSYDRETFKQVTSQQAFELLRRHLVG